MGRRKGVNLLNLGKEEPSSVLRPSVYSASAGSLSMI